MDATRADDVTPTLDELLTALSDAVTAFAEEDPRGARLRWAIVNLPGLIAARDHNALLLDAIRLVGKSSWDAPGWTLHVPRGRAALLWDVAYQHRAAGNPLDGGEVHAVRARLNDFLAAAHLSGERTDG